MAVFLARPCAGTVSLPMLGDFDVGTVVKVNVNGTAKEFIIVHQGKPSSLYDDSCNGTWLLMKDCYESRAWHNSVSNSYKASDIHSYLNSTFLSLFNADIKEAVKQVKIPYVKGTGGSAVASGANGLSTKIFLLSGYEVGWAAVKGSSNTFPVDGAKLSYFIASTDGNARRIASLSGSATKWWLRSPQTGNTTSVWSVNTDGDTSGSYPNHSRGIRPAFVLPATTSVGDGNLIGG